MSTPATGASVLVVEDEQSTAAAYARILDEEGHDVQVATTGADALDRIDDAVDVVVLDRRMPGLSGAEVLEAIAEQSLECRVAIVTAVEPDFDILEFDIDAYLRKPVDVDDLATTVAALAKLDTYEALQRELGTARVKRNVLDVEKDPATLADHDDYQRLEARIERLKERIAAIEAAHPTYFGDGQ